jgi:hypothetical protein
MTNAKRGVKSGFPLRWETLAGIFADKNFAGKRRGKDANT